ncbi:MAG: hypothetical protein PHP42_00460 [Bacteroidota bacterium]|nr:hypothetical protein [Bacteroidota bacterium]
MKNLLVVLFLAGISLFCSSCVKSTSSDKYDAVWKPYSSTIWAKQSAGITNFAAADGGCNFDATITTASIADTVWLIPTMYNISNIESGKNPLLTISASVSSNPDSMKLDSAHYTYFQFGRLDGTIQTFGKDSVRTQPRSFASNTLYSYAPSIRPDSCSRQMYIQIILHWNSYSGPAVLDTLKSAKISVQLKNISFAVSGIDILK